MALSNAAKAKCYHIDVNSPVDLTEKHAAKFGYHMECRVWYDFIPMPNGKTLQYLPANRGFGDDATLFEDGIQTRNNP